MSLESLFASIRQLVQNPTSNLAATSLGFAIIVVLILVLIMVALIALLPRSGRQSEPETRDEGEYEHFDDDDDSDGEAVDEVSAAMTAESPMRALARRSRPLLVALLVLIAITATYVSSATSEYCSGTCHIMLESGDSWAKSPHANTPCVRCHEQSIVDAAATRTRHVVAELASSSGFTRRAAVSSRQCLGCHQNILGRTLTTDRGVRVEHGHIIAAGTDCMRCHVTAGHSDGPSTRRGTMSDCLRCHDDVTALSGCFICHEGDVARAAISDRTFGKTKLPTPRCGGCHEQDSCDDCHGLRMPHPDNYADPRQHARAGAFDARENLCYRCHTKNDCGECHNNIEAGHPVGWEQTHKSSPRSQGSGYCLSCHKTKDFCEVCHPR